MNVTKVKTTRDCALFKKVWLKGTFFYITPPYREGRSTVDWADVFSYNTYELLGQINDHWFDFENKLFEEVK